MSKINYYKKFKKAVKKVIKSQENTDDPVVVWFTGICINNNIIAISFSASLYKKWVKELHKIGGIYNYFNLKNHKIRRLTLELHNQALINKLPADRLLKKIPLNIGLCLIGYSKKTDNIVLVTINDVPIVPTLDRLRELNREALRR